MKISVIKVGGSTLAGLSNQFYEGLAERLDLGEKLVIVHGGGPAINEQLEALAIPNTFVNGLRKTTQDVLTVAESILCGQMNKGIVRRLHQVGIGSVGICGCDAQTFLVRPIDYETLGFVGEITKVNTKLVDMLLENAMIPVIAPIGMDNSGQPFNVNADTAAAAIASALHADELVFVTDVDGVFNNGQLISELDERHAKALIADGVIRDGMVPKVSGALASLSDRLTKVRIINGQNRFKKASGTLIVKESIVIQ